MPRIRKLLLRFALAPVRKKIWLSTYFTPPPFWWTGPQLVFVHDLIHEMLPSFFPDAARHIRLKKAAIERADAVLCNSHTTAKDLHDFYSVPSSKVSVAELGCSSVFRQRGAGELQLQLPFPYVLYVGSRWQYKGFDTLLTAFSDWSGKKDTKLVVVGAPWSPQEDGAISALGLKERILLLSQAGDDQLCDLYNEARAFVYPSIYEGFGVVLLEAMASGCPIVASRIPSTLEVAQDIPFYFEPGDASGLVEALAKATGSGRSARRILRGTEVVQSYTWSRTAEKLHEVLSTLGRCT